MPEERWDWQEIVDLKPKGYAEVQFQEKGVVFHGPVESVEIVEINAADMVVITLKWVGQMGLPGQSSFGKWTKGPEYMRIIQFPNLAVPFTHQTVKKGKRIIFKGAAGDVHLMYLDPVQSHVKFDELESAAS